MDPRYQTVIPDAAVERITATHPDSTRARAEYVLEGEVVGCRYWDADGSLSMETPLKHGVKHGVEYIFRSNGQLVLAEPYVEGRVHGTAQQWDHDGQLIGTYTLVHGTGIDLWRRVREDGTVFLAEVWHYRDGRVHGFEWWIDENQRAVYEERHWKDGQPHGIEREWNWHGRLRRGFPKYFVNGQQVTKRRYLTACKRDASLPPFRVEENAPERTFPPEIQRELQPVSQSDGS